MATNPPSHLLCETLLARLAKLEASSGISASSVIGAATTAALDHFDKFGALPSPMSFPEPAKKPANIIQLREHIIPPDDDNPPPAVSMAMKA